MKKKKIVIAPDSFKESMTAQQAAEAIAKGVKSVFQDKLDLELIPMADGGEGTIQSLADALDGTTHSKKVTGPLGNSVIANYAISGDKTTAIIEMAEASGIALVPSEIRNPLKTTTHGTGQLIQAALDHNVEKIILGIGGSATNDGGAGMVEALGGKLLNSEGNSIPSGGGSLIDLDDIDLSNLDKRLQDVQIIVACDVDNPLLGEYGASAIYGPQKGADKKMVSDLDSALSNYHDVLERVTKKSVKDIPGAGAAGGLGAGLLAFLHAKLEPGVEIVLKETNFYERVVDADLVLTGEGKIDGQTIYGKTPIGVAKATKRFNIPVIALSGTLGTDYEKVYNHGIDAAFSIVQGPCDLEDALKNGPNYLEGLARNVAKLLVIH
ncbi:MULTISPECIES: glycerate kinase [Oceanobacillus]|uniref:Glycerate kinase n=1 Tax=Oceanobacillus kimchii TaxID=746691 RepID=A0ABQ5TKR7_9BACI|nr:MULTISPECIES: glycerate kinase [Oceanobacillus]MBT2600393.1 glycerate kinase [Oceanobacillus sp. ISL-74]MBT2650551.1 glycerate kinase [Oceanobacillus sp. ISL-73]GLO67443.1 glycerate kinase [Oceanobacillus kimchii]